MNTCRYCGLTYQAYIIHHCPQEFQSHERQQIHEQWKSTVDAIGAKLDRMIELLEKREQA